MKVVNAVKRNPVMAFAVATWVLALLTRYGVPIDEDLATGLLTALLLGGGAFVRGKVHPLAMSTKALAEPDPPPLNIPPPAPAPAAAPVPASAVTGPVAPPRLPGVASVWPPAVAPSVIPGDGQPPVPPPPPPPGEVPGPVSRADTAGLIPTVEILRALREGAAEGAARAMREAGNAGSTLAP